MIPIKILRSSGKLKNFFLQLRELQKNLTQQKKIFLASRNFLWLLKFFRILENNPKNILQLLRVFFEELEIFSGSKELFFQPKYFFFDQKVFLELSETFLELS